MKNPYITTWYKEIGENKELHYNHLSMEPFDPTLLAPVPKTPEQKVAWAKQKWHSRPAVLHNHIVEEAPEECPIGVNHTGICSASYCRACIIDRLLHD